MVSKSFLAAQKGIQQAALPRIVIHNQAARRARRRFGQFGRHSPSLDKSAGRQKKFCEARFYCKGVKAVINSS
jgi:hypothetical protein